MKSIKTIFTFILFTILFYSCSKESNNDELNKSYELNQKFTLTNSTNEVSELFLNLGVVEIILSKEENSIVYNFITEKEFYINEELVNLADYKIYFKDGTISLMSNPNRKLTILNDQPYLISPSFTGYLSSDEFFKEKEINILLFFMKEMITPLNYKKNSQELISDSQLRGCSFGNTVYIYSTGLSRSVAMANLPAEIASYQNPYNIWTIDGCSAFGSVDVSCLWDNHACVATQAFCCN